MPCERCQLEIAGTHDSALDCILALRHEVSALRLRIAARDKAAVSGFTRRSVLIVDDEPLLLKALVRHLAEHSTHCVARGEDALACIESGADYDAILYDFMIPDLSGDAFYASVRALRGGFEKRIVFMTGGLSSDLESFLETIPNACVRKPFDVEQLLQALDAAAKAS